MPTFATISDTHIRNLKFHEEMKAVFEEIYDSLRIEPPDYILHLGDLCHSKTHLSPEYFELASQFLKSLASIAETYIIPGNHDFSSKNLSRQDAITPIVTALNLSTLHYLKFSQEVELKNNIVLNVHSLFDKENWKKPSNPDKTNILLFHGSIKGCNTEEGNTDWAEYDKGILEGFDYAFLGDIHMCQSVDELGKMRYIGSTMQESFADADNKGFLVWEILDKKNFTCEQVVINSSKPFITLKFNENCEIDDNYIIKPNSRIRITTDWDLPTDVVKRALGKIRTEFKPEALFFLDNSKFNKNPFSRPGKIYENFQDITTQEKMIRDYFGDSKINEQLYGRIFQLNQYYNEVIQGEENEIARNVRWKIKSAEWGSLFNYGDFNYINFENLSGVVGLFGKSYSGKSNCIGSILLTIFNRLPKKSCKNVEIVNQNKDLGYGKVELQINDWVYTIYRTIEKYIKRLHGEETEDARMVLEFSRKNLLTGQEENLNGESRDQTDANIRKIFGTIDDFLLTSMTSQFGALDYVNEGSTKRKEILAKFLDLDVFSKKYELAKKDVGELKDWIKRHEKSDFEKEIEDVEEKLRKDLDALDNCKVELDTILGERSKLSGKLNKIVSKLPKLSLSVDSFEVLNKQKQVFLEYYNKITSKINLITEDISSKESLRKKIEKFETEMFNVGEFKERLKKINQKTEEIRDITAKIGENEIKLQNYQKKQKLLQGIPCGEQYKECKFIHDAFESREKIVNISQVLVDLNGKIEELSNAIKLLEPTKTKEYLGKYESILQKKNKNLLELAERKADLEKQNAILVKVNQDLETQEQKIEEYQQNESLFKKAEKLVKEKEEVEKKLIELNDLVSSKEKKIVNITIDKTVAERKLSDLEEQKKEYEEKLQEYSAYEYFMQCCHPSGIPFEIIKSKLPVINEEISKILTNIAKFEVFLENNEDKLNIFIKHPKYGKRTISLASGTELLLAAFAIRLAFIKISSLPRCDGFLVLDEPAVNFDEAHLAAFGETIEGVLKKEFEMVLLMSHLEILKDSADWVLPLEKDAEGYAKIVYRS